MRRRKQCEEPRGEARRCPLALPEGRVGGEAGRGAHGFTRQAQEYGFRVQVGVTEDFNVTGLHWVMF